MRRAPSAFALFRLTEHVAMVRNEWQDRRMTSESMPSTAIRRGLADILIRVHAGEHIPITHYERPAAVMVPPDWYQAAVALMVREGSPE